MKKLDHHPGLAWLISASIIGLVPFPVYYPVVSGLLVDNDPCPCQNYCTATCGYHESGLANLLYTLSLPPIVYFFILLLALPGFIWALDNKAFDRKTLRAICIICGTFTVALVAAIFSAGLISYWLHIIVLGQSYECMLFVWLWFNVLAFFPWRKKMNWRKAVVIPSLILLLEAGISIGTFTGPLDFTCTSIIFAEPHASANTCR